MPFGPQDFPRLSSLYKTVLQSVVNTANPRFEPNHTLLDKVSLFQGDITIVELDSIVNAANRSLLGGGGVDGAIHRAAGRKLLNECSKLNGCETGDAKITGGYNLPSKYVIHTVGPIYSSSKIQEVRNQLASCYRRSLSIAAAKSLKHIAFPSISTGVYGYPIEDATHAALETTRRFLETPEGSKLDLVVFVVWSDLDREVYETLLPEYFPHVSSETSGNGRSESQG